MKQTVVLAGLLLMCASSTANALFFFFMFPTGGGGQGDQCVSAEKKAGDTFRSANGNVAMIKYLSGASSRCTDPTRPVLAKMEFTASSTFAPKAGMNLPDGYLPQSLTDSRKFNGALLYAKNNATDSHIFVVATTRDAISDVHTYAMNLRKSKAGRVNDAEQSEIEPLNINGMKAWRFQTKGNEKNPWATSYTFVTTILEGDVEVVSVDAWTKSANLEVHKVDLKQVAFGVSGINAVSPAQQTPPSSAAPVADTSSERPASIDTAPAMDASSQSSTPSLTQSSAPAAIAVTTTPAVTGSPADRLRELDKLRKEGVISAQEFEDKKKEILKSM